MKRSRKPPPVSGVFLAALILLSVPSLAQSNNWAWMAGSQTPQQARYGVLGTPAATNLPGNRESAVSWTDSKGNLWLFGGDGQDSTGQFGILNDVWEFNPSTSEWTWMGGANIANAIGVQGTLGTPATGNVPSSRYGGVGWTDAKGNLWLFGGDATLEAGAGIVNDLWEFSPSTNQWAWMGGSDSPASCTNGTCAGTYGMLGTAASGNIPGARTGATSWTDNQGNLWLFGGYGFDASGVLGWLNDLWEFNPSTLQWAWMGGSTTIPSCTGDCGSLGVYGVVGIPAAANVPGGRFSASGMTDSTGNLWLFGGLGEDSAGSFGLLNDLWKFNPSTNRWTWMGGSNTYSPCSRGLPEECGTPGVYGTLGTPAGGNLPGARSGQVGWTDDKGNLWLFGGEGIDANGVWGYLDDLWEYTPATNQWAWVSGGSTVSCVAVYCGQPGSYGTLQVASPSNSPSGRQYAAAWTDPKGNFWLFGGTGVDAAAEWDYFQDLWEFQPNTNGLPVVATPTISPGSGSYSTWITVTIDDTTPGATIDYNINGSPAVVYSGPFTVSSTEMVQTYASASGYANSALATADYVADLPPTTPPSFSVAPGTYATTQTVSITDATTNATIYYAIGAAPTTSSTIYSGPIAVSAPEVLEAIAVADNHLNSNVATATYNIGVNPSGKWAWMGGSSTVPGCSNCGQPGWYGTLQMPSPENAPPARWGAASWTDSNGNLWLFGGDGPYLLNDLWEFDPATAQWEWMTGSDVTAANLSGVYGTLSIAAAGNTPGARVFPASWTDTQGTLWLFGGRGIDAAGNQDDLNDLWKFSPSTRLWTWMGGSSTFQCAAMNDCYEPFGVYGTMGTPAPGNIPGGRSEAAKWVDKAGNLWLYGGLGADSRGLECYLDDLWEFDLSTDEWAWMGGSRLCPDYLAGFPGVYGALGVPAAENVPWSLAQATGWTDSTGNLWLFGGTGEDTSATGYPLNDMWEFYPAIDEWAFTSINSLSSTGQGTGVYGTMGAWSAANTPGERSNPVGWTDNAGNFWLFGGTGLTSSFPEAILNDLWEFKPSINEWAWMGGSSTSVCLESNSGICVGNGQPGVYGVLGTPSAANAPGGRNSAATWTDKAGNLWLFGGFGYDAQTGDSYLNDLWEYSFAGQPSAISATPAATPVLSIAAGNYTSPQVLTITDQSPGATIYYTTSGMPPGSTSSVYIGPITVSSTETVEAIAVAKGYSVSAQATAAYTFNVPQTPTPTFSVPAGTYATAQSVAISDAILSANIYYTTDGTSPTGNSIRYSSPIPVSSAETIQAIAAASGYLSSSVASATYTFSAAPDFSLSASAVSLMLNPGQTGTINLSVAPINGFSAPVAFSCSGLPAGVSCSFSPLSVTPSGTTASTSLTVTAATSALLLRPELVRIYLGSLLVVTLCFYRRRPKWLYLPILLLFAMASLGSIEGCGSATSPSAPASAPQPVTATITLTATGGLIQHTTTLALTVN